MEIGDNKEKTLKIGLKSVVQLSLWVFIAHFSTTFFILSHISSLSAFHSLVTSSTRTNSLKENALHSNGIRVDIQGEAMALLEMVI